MAILACAVAACGGGGEKPEVTVQPAQQASGQVWSMTAVPQQEPAPVTAEDIVRVYMQAFDLAHGAGARGQMTTKQWRELEPTAGNFPAKDWQDVEDALNFARAKGLRQFIGIQLINTTQREMPADMALAPFDSAVVKTRLRALLARLIKGREGRIAYLSIGNEVDAYLRTHGSEWKAYRALYEDAIAYVHQLDPGIQVGVTATADGAMGLSMPEVRELNTQSEVVIYTYYPLDFHADGTVHVRDPAVVQGEFKAMLALAGDKPLVLQEAGYPASPLNDSSEARQADFIRNLFAAWRQAGSKVPYLNVFLLHDLTASQCEGLTSYYGSPPSGQASFKAFLCTLGMLQANGTPRLAWSALREAAANPP